MGRSTKPSIPISIPPGTRVVRIERALGITIVGVATREPSWIVWTNPAPDWQSGTFLRLYSDGRAERVTLYDDGTEDITDIKGKDR